MFDFDDLIRKLIDSSKLNQNKKAQIKKDTWKDCVKLMEEGWEILSNKKINDSVKDEIVLIWQKGNDKRETVLSYKEQCLWLEYLFLRQERLE